MIFQDIITEGLISMTKFNFITALKDFEWRVLAQNEKPTVAFTNS